MASEDFYTFSARQRLQQISAGRAQALADLEVAKASADYDSAGQAVQQIANLDAEAKKSCRAASAVRRQPDATGTG